LHGHELARVDLRVVLVDILKDLGDDFSGDVLQPEHEERATPA
jgi:hypothetical protein